MKEVKHITILIIVIIYIFSSDVIFDQELKITFRKPSGPLKKSTPPKNLEIASPPPPAFFKNFSSPPLTADREGVRGEDSVSNKSILNRKPIYLSEFSYSNMGSLSS